MNRREDGQIFYLDEEDRYARMRLISWWDQDRLRSSRVLVVGAGALGNEVLKNLALLGVGHIFVIDFDKIETTNLTRSVLFRAEDRGYGKAYVAAAGVLRINPDVKVTALNGNVLTDLGLGVFRDIDLAIGCLDNREARLWVNRQCWKADKPWVDGGIQEISGVVKVIVPGKGACYECAMTEMDYRLINLRYSCPLLSRDDMAMGRVPTAPTIASMIAGMQVQEALKLLHGRGIRSGCATVFDGHSNQMYTTELPFKEDCLSHETLPDVRSVPFSAKQTLAEMFAEVHKQTGASAPLTVKLPHDLVHEVECDRCRIAKPIIRPQPLVVQSEALCDTCEQLGRAKMVHEITEGDPLASHPMSRLGIAPYDVVRLFDEANESAWLLEADREIAWRQFELAQ